MPQPKKRTKFLLELIKPSHYDDDGYVIHWRRGFVPSNSLSTLYGLAVSARERRILGDQIEIEIGVVDESNSVVRVERIIRRFERNSNRGLVCLVGVQTNQFARALDIARPLRRAGIQVIVGGFHVSGCISMLPELTPELKEALGLGISLFAGEAEGRLDEILRAAYEGRLQPLYNFLTDLPHLENQPLPFLPLSYIRRYAGMMGCFDAGRGCPFACSFCTIINVQGRKSRFRTSDEIQHLVRANYAQGVRSMFITDDDFARNKRWEEIFDRLIELREKEGFNFTLMLQADTLAYKIPNFVAKAARAGCDRVCIGLESINPGSLKGASKNQNHIGEYRRMLQVWRNAGVLTYAGYILGFPTDTPQTIARDIRIIQRELPVDMLHFFILTPLPGSKDHQKLYLSGERLESDTNRYDTEHATSDHPRMTSTEWEAIYKEAWRLYYSPEHIETLLRRAVATGISSQELAITIFHYYASQTYEGVHPLQAGLIRRKVRSQRRGTFVQENRLVFCSRRLKEGLCTYVPALWFRWKLNRLRKRIERDPMAKDYRDVAIMPASEESDQALELYMQNDAG